MEHYTAQAVWGEFCHVPPRWRWPTLIIISRALELMEKGEPLKARVWLQRMPDGDKRRQALLVIQPELDQPQPAMLASLMEKAAKAKVSGAR